MCVHASGLWGRARTKRNFIGVHKNVCVGITHGGFGFLNLTLFNQSLLPKHAWHIYKKTNSLAARAVKGFYFANFSFI